MKNQFDFIQSELAAGRVVLAYDRKTIMKPIRVKAVDCAIVAGVLHINGMPANGWTFARKP